MKLAAAAIPVEVESAPGRIGTKLFYSSKEAPLRDTMPQRSMDARNAVIDRYDQRADFLGLYQPDWNATSEVPDGDYKFTKSNAHEKLSNTLGASKAADHKVVRAGTLHMGQHPWDQKTTFLTIEKPETSSGWDLTCTVDRKLQASRIAAFSEKSAYNTVVKQEQMLGGYSNPSTKFKTNHEKQRQSKRDEIERKKNDIKAPYTGDVKVKARPKTSLDDILAVEALDFPEDPSTPEKPQRGSQIGSRQQSATGSSASGSVKSSQHSEAVPKNRPSTPISTVEESPEKPPPLKEDSSEASAASPDARATIKQDELDVGTPSEHGALQSGE